MSSKYVDIRNKCPNDEIGKVSPCQDDRRIEAIRKSLNGTDYECCTHTGSRFVLLINLNYGGKRLKIEKGGVYAQFNARHIVVSEVTIYYHEQYGSNGDHITKPLILRVKSPIRGYTWYENTGNGVTWRPINGTGKFPKGNTDPASTDFIQRLKDLTCTLHHRHRVNIGEDYKDKGDFYSCDLCSKAKVAVQQGQSVDGIYTKFVHTPHYYTTDEKYYIAYNDILIKFQGSGVRSNLISVSKKDCTSLSVYYWIGDEHLDNPLLIEVKLSKGESSWYENIGEYGTTKHDIWRKLGEQEAGKLSSSVGELKAKLDRLSCIFNETVKIQLGKHSVCHNSRYGGHMDRLNTFYNGMVDSSLKLSAYVYTPNKDSGSCSFHVVEILLAEKKQNFPGGTSFFKDVTKITAYASSCDSSQPFLLCIKSGNSSEKWYKRTSTYAWKDCDDIKDQFGEIFSEARDTLGIQACPSYKPPKKGVQIKITEKPTGDGVATMYYDSSSGNTPIFVTKDANNLPHGFFRITHRVSTETGSFTVSNTLGNGDGIREGTTAKPIEGVQYVEVYFGNSRSDIPILIAVNKASNGNFQYYSRAEDTKTGKGIWVQRYYKSLSPAYLDEMLDDQNCTRNGAIPVDLKYPSDLKLFYTDINNRIGTSPHLKTKFVRKSVTSPDLPQGAKKDYEVETYNINTVISRLTYGGTETIGIDLPGDNVSELRIYKWSKDLKNIPLLVEFISSGQSSWYENLGQESFTWRVIRENEATNFYELSGFPSKLDPEFAKKLHSISCKIHHTVKIDISKNSGRYCHGKCTYKRIKVEKEDTLFEDYICYEHTSRVDNEKFMVTAITNNGQKQNVDGLPLINVNRVTVYFSNCSLKTPVMIYIEHGVKGNGRGDSKWLKNEGEQNWKDVSQNIPVDGKDGTTMTESIKRILEEVKTSLKICSGILDTAKSLQPDLLARAEKENEKDDYDDKDESEDEDEEYESPVSSQLPAALSQTAPSGPPTSETPRHTDNQAAGTQSGSSAEGTPGRVSQTAPPAATVLNFTVPTEDITPKPPNHANAAAQSTSVPGLGTRPPGSLDSPGGTPSWKVSLGSGIATGILGTSALACFAGWKLYNRYKGDPWVRQI
ncbi:hypothetical protein BEWA_026640 [Theileria equi strain WA]|uniref:Uncharacterized protein n=1 Tax=Theileria equi strain WA TaxID=1537102 RepID=L0AW93_THEEQ|nr:hypothetical protein BEWA_026640 [Theileria equi strain WA]AFZ79815.1 hypothetical protein BEWA_026640 [Theileria equi strain WA]|eukprot:XP_004829481.1 hypothetical protein BEWA_026640 [Theileria equi strain WA]